MTYYIQGNCRSASEDLSELLLHCMQSFSSSFEELVILCIGSDRLTGDSLGPLVGSRLHPEILSHTSIYGTLNNPVHALNLKKTIQMLSSKHPHSLIIAVDASVGSKEHQGYITLEKGALTPGLGVQKKLPPVGDICITGIVNLAGAFEHILLQNTRLSLVMSLADTIASGIMSAHHQYYHPRRRGLLARFQFPEERFRIFAKFIPRPASFTSDESNGSV